MPEMTASELARIVEGWPEGARPKDYANLPVFALPDDLLDPVGVSLDRIGLAHQIDLACMAGLRWLAKGAHSVTWGNGAGGVWLTGLGGKLGRIDVMEPTLLHAIDAAIRSIK